MEKYAFTLAEVLITLGIIGVVAAMTLPSLVNRTLFMFQLTKEGKVLPMGAENTYWEESREELCSNTSSSSMNGFTCAYYAVTDKDYFKKLH